MAEQAIKKGMGVLAISPADKGGRLYSPSDILLEASKPFHPLELAYRFLLAKGITTLSLGATNKKDFEFANKLRNSCERLSTPEKNALNKIEELANKRLDLSLIHI